VHRYRLIPRDDGTLVDYTIDVWPVNYTPYWLRPGMKAVTRRLVRVFTQRHLANLACLAETTDPASAGP